MREFQEFKDSELQLAQLAKELKEGTFVYHMNKAIAAHERGDAKKKQMHLDNAKTARYSMKSTEIAKHKDLLGKYSQMREEVELDEAETHYEHSNNKKSSCNENRATISFRAFLAKLEEAKKYVEEDEDDEEERADERADKKSDRRDRTYPVKMHAGDDDGKNLGEEFELDEGQTVKTKTGVIHKGSYGSEYEGNEKKKEAPAVKRGRGRPKKGSDESSNAKKYTFHDLLNRLSR